MKNFRFIVKIEGDPDWKDVKKISWKNLDIRWVYIDRKMVSPELIKSIKIITEDEENG